MAEIKVEKRNKAPIWPWVIGILVLLALIWFLIDAFTDNSEEYEMEEIERQEVEGKIGSSSFDEYQNSYTLTFSDLTRA